jgi:putative ABC transport system ATP-binding protein
MLLRLGFDTGTFSSGPPPARLDIVEGPIGRTACGGAMSVLTSAVDARAGHAGTRIDLDGVCRHYRVGGAVVRALDDVDLHVDESAFVVVLGASGSGKTTLLNMVGALDSPTAGTVRLAGTDLTSARPAERTRIRRHTVSFVFQSFNLFPGLTAAENVQFGADVAGRTDPGTVAREVLAQVGLGDRASHFAHQLSGGEQQRVAIARALATGNPILLADEPTGELDFRTGVTILELLRAQAEAGKTVLVVTHNREISRVADRVIELSSGRIVADGPPVGGRASIDELHW